MSSAIQKVWVYRSFEPGCFAIRDPEVEGFYVHGPFQPIRTRFATYGQAVAAIGHALDEEWDKIQALKGEASPRRWAKIVFVTKGAAVLELSEITRSASLVTSYFVLFRGFQVKAADLDTAKQRAVTPVGNAAKHSKAADQLDDTEEPSRSNPSF